MSAREAWDREVSRLRPEIMRDAVADALRKMAGRVFAEQDAEIARLNAELDRYQGRQVLYTTDAHLDTAAIASLDAADGTILRATDTGRELLMHGGTWAER